MILNLISRDVRGRYAAHGQHKPRAARVSGLVQVGAKPGEGVRVRPVLQVEEALAVNSGQKLVCDFEMKNNAVMSYDVRSPGSCCARRV